MTGFDSFGQFRKTHFQSVFNIYAALQPKLDQLVGQSHCIDFTAVYMIKITVVKTKEVIAF